MRGKPNQVPVGGGPGLGRDDGQLLHLALPLVPQATPEMAYQLQSWGQGHSSQRPTGLGQEPMRAGAGPLEGRGAPSQGVHCRPNIPHSFSGWLQPPCSWPGGGWGGAEAP